MIHVPLFIAKFIIASHPSLPDKILRVVVDASPCTRKFSNARGERERASASRAFSTHGRLKNCRAIAKSAPLKFTANSVPMSRRVIDRRDFRNTKGVRAVPAQ